MTVLKVLALAGSLALAPAAAAWGWQSGACDVRSPNQLATDGGSDVVCRAPGSAIKLSGATGAVLWRTIAPDSGVVGPAEDWAAVATDAAADVIVGGFHTDVVATAPELVTRSTLLVVKLAAASGAEVWRRAIGCPGSGNGWVTRLALDPAGDVVVLGYICGHQYVLKLSGASGEELWRRPEGYVTISVGADGDLVAARPSVPAEAPRIGVVEKLAGTDGAVVWSRALRPSRALASLALDGAGNVLLPGTRDFGVVKLARGSGTPAWSRRIRGSTRPFPYTVRRCGENGQCRDEEVIYHPVNVARAVAATPRGDAIAVGMLDNFATKGDFTVMKLGAGRGTERWRRVIKGRYGDTDIAFDEARTVTVDGRGDVFAAGGVAVPGGVIRQLVKLSGKSGTQLWRIPGQRDASATRDAVIVLDAAGNALAANVLAPLAKLRSRDGGDF